MSARVTEWMATRVTEYASRLTRRSLARQPSAIRALQPLVAQPGMISLGGGMPNPSTFPFTKITASLRDGSEIELGGARLEASLQYSPTLGLPSLRAHLQALQEAEHGLRVGEEAPPSGARKQKRGDSYAAFRCIAVAASHRGGTDGGGRPTNNTRPAKKGQTGMKILRDGIYA